eukprot:COSAG06_NODE_152_length_21942_cov_4.593234_10_plen_81_part_00
MKPLNLSSQAWTASRELRENTPFSSVWTRHWAGKCGYVLSEKALCPTIRKVRPRSGGKTAFFEPLYAKNDHSTKTGSGQT